jgi:hypothetical protein
MLYIISVRIIYFPYSILRLKHFIQIYKYIFVLHGGESLSFTNNKLKEPSDPHLPPCAYPREQHVGLPGADRLANLTEGGGALS